MSINHKKSAWVILGVTAVICVALAMNYMSMWPDDLILPGPGVTQTKWLSDYVPELKGTKGDTRVFILEGKKPGATIMVLTGHHADEPGGWMASIVLVENAVVEEGKLVVIPQANNSAFTHNYPQEAHPQHLHFTLPDGSNRVFRHGSRTSNSINHWPDPEVFIQYPSGQKLSGDEVRNLNRAYPGRLNGTFTERVGYAIRQVLEKEGVLLVMDLHEAQPEYPFVNAIGAHPRAQELATMASLGMQMQNLDLSVEAAPAKFRGLSYRELGDHTKAKAVLMETCNPSQGKIRGITDETLIIKGIDAFYVAAAKLGRTFVPYDEKGWPLERRMGRHLAAFMELALALTEEEGTTFVINHVPTNEDINAKGVGAYLNRAARM
jgi:predicted deacylase